MKPWILVLAFAVLAGGVYLRHAARRADPPTPVSIDSPRAAQGAGRAPARLALSRPVLTAPAHPVADRGEHAADAPAARDGAAAEVPTVADMGARIERAFVAEPSATSPELARDLDTAVRAVLPAGSAVHRVECRGALCRIETAHLGLDELRDFAQRAFQGANPVSKGPVFFSLLGEPEPGQPVVAVAYVGREGAELPMGDRPRR